MLGRHKDGFRPEEIAQPGGMASFPCMCRRVFSLVAALILVLCLILYNDHHAQVTRRDDVTSLALWTQDVEAQIQFSLERHGSSDSIALDKVPRASHDLPMYLNGELILEGIVSSAAVTEVPKTLVLPVERGPGFECPSNLATPVDEYDSYRNLSLRHPAAMLKYTRLRNIPPLVILTPISNAAKHLVRYFSHVCSLTYPHSKISLVLGEDSSQDDTYDVALRHMTSLQPFFRNVKLFRLKRNENPWPHQYRHDESYQVLRRGHLAKSRNQLLSVGLRDETWVLWLDSDVAYIPPDIIEQLMSSEKDIVVPACMYRKQRGDVEIYDKNTWRETEESRNYLRKRQKDFLMLEGYSPTMREYLTDLRHGQRVVEIDGVGGCVMLIKANIHRDGLIFPPFVFEHEIETEGLGRLAQEMGYHLYGMPYVEVFH